jgi:hypothetical protein
MQPQQYREARSHEDWCTHAVYSKLLCLPHGAITGSIT